MAVPAATRRRTWKTGTRPCRVRRLPRLGWWWLGIPAALYIAARTWPVQSAILGVIAAAAVIVYVVRPRLLNPLIQRIDRGIHQIVGRRRSLPAPGHITLDTFLRMHHTGFEHAVAELLTHQPDVAHIAVVGGSSDRGVDNLVTLHNGRRILVQCKRYTPGKKSVGGATVREILGSVTANQCHHGVIITTSGYTHEALATNGSLGPAALTLINGSELVALANGHPTRLW